jgi:hypothetical protein
MRVRSFREVYLDEKDRKVYVDIVFATHRFHKEHGLFLIWHGDDAFGLFSSCFNQFGGVWQHVLIPLSNVEGTVFLKIFVPYVMMSCAMYWIVVMKRRQNNLTTGRNITAKYLK